MGDEIKLVISGDPAGIKRAALESANALDKIKDSGAKLTEQSGRNVAAAERFIESLKREAVQLTLGERALQHYELAQLRLTEAANKEAAALIDAVDAVKKHNKATEEAEAAHVKLGRTLGATAAAAAAAAVAIAAVVVKKSVDAAIEAEQAHAKLEAVIKATGYAAGLTGRDIEDHARRLASTTRFTVEEVKDASAVLLTFRSISRDSFAAALEAAANLAATMGTNLNPAIVMIGKAVQDPIEGLASLERAGIGLNGSQKETIRNLVEMGDKGRALNVILQEMKEKGLDGVANAMNTGLTKAVSDNGKEWNRLFETLGKTDAIGGAVQRKLGLINDLLGDLTRQIDGTSNSYSELLAQLARGAAPASAALAQLLSIASRALDNSNRSKGAISREAVERQAAEVGRLAEEIRKAQDLLTQKEKKTKEAAEREAKAYAQVTQSVERFIAALEKEAATLGMTTAERKLYEAAQQASRLHTQAEREALMDRARAATETIEANRKLMAQQKEENEENEKRFAAREKYEKSLEDGTAAIQRELDALVKHNDEFGKSRQVIEQETLAKMENKLATLEVTSATEKERQELEKRVNLQRQLIVEGARSDVAKAGKREADELAKNYERATEQIERSLTDAIMAGGKSGRDYVEGLFKNLVLRPIVEASVQAGLGAMGMNAGPGGARGAGVSLPGGIPGSFTGYLGSGISTLGGWLGSSGISQFGAGISGTAQGMANFMGPTLPGTIPSGAAGLGASFAEALPYIGWAIAAYQLLDSIFNDGPENPRVQLAFGRGGVPTQLGSIGFAQNQGGIDTPAAEAYFRQVAGIFSPITSRFGDDAMGRVQARLAGAGQREFAFPEGDPAAQMQILNETLRQIGIAVFEEVNPALSAFLEGLDAADNRIPNIVQGFIALTDAGEQIDQVVNQISDSVMGPLRAQLDALETQEQRARAAFEASLAGDDPMAVAQAQQTLMAAVVNRYQAETQLVRQLADQVAAIQEQAYQFALSIAQKINAVGGSIDVGAISLDRASAIRGSLSSDPGRRASQVQSYVSAVDAWYAARRAEIDRRNRADAEAAAQASAIYAGNLQAEQAINQIRIQGLQKELQLVQQWQGVLDRSKTLLDQMRLTSANPLSASGRLGLAQADSELARVAFQSAAGEARPGSASRYLDALQRQLGMLGEVYQRPSAEYQAGYNDIIRQITEVQGEAQTQADRALDIQASIEALTERNNKLAEMIQMAGAATAGNTAQTNAELAELDEEARGYYEWARDEGEAAFAEAERRHQEQLVAITGGMDVDLYMAANTARTNEVLRDIKELIRKYLENFGAGSSGSSASGSQGEPDGGSAGTGSEKSAGVTIQINAPAAVSPTQILEAIRYGAPVIKRAIQNA
ncbi:MAG: phage tail length tape measure family protein [Burkholderiales bacterium]